MTTFTKQSIIKHEFYKTLVRFGLAKKPYSFITASFTNTKPPGCY